MQFVLSGVQVEWVAVQVVQGVTVNQHAVAVNADLRFAAVLTVTKVCARRVNVTVLAAALKFFTGTTVAVLGWVCLLKLGSLGPMGKLDRASAESLGRCVRTGRAAVADVRLC